MRDVYLLATPLLVLGVLALVRFIGCLIKPDRPLPLPPENLMALAGDRRVTLRWDPSPFPEATYVVKRGTTPGVHDTALPAVPTTQLTTVDTNLPAGLRQFYVVVNVESNGQEGKPSNEATAVPGIGLVTSTTLGTLRTDAFNGWIGMLVRIGPNPLTIIGLGRIFLAGSVAAHAMKVVDATTTVDVPGAATVVDLSAANVPDKAFAYGLLQNPVTLSANTQYYVISQESTEPFYDLDTTVLTTAAATVVSAVFGDGVAAYTRSGGPGQTYGPVDLLM